MSFNKAQKIYLISLLKAELGCVQDDLKLVNEKTKIAKEYAYTKATNILITKERFIQELIGIIEEGEPRP